MNKYRFFINDKAVKPLYAEDLAVEYKREDGQQYFRPSLSGNLTFLREDYDLIDSGDIEQDYQLLIQVSADSVNWATYFEGLFYKTDCKFNADDRSVEASITTKDEYTDLLAGLNNEVDILKLKNPIENVSVEISKRPIIQIYLYGSSKLSGYQGYNYWEQDVKYVPDLLAMADYYHFYPHTYTFTFTLTGNNAESLGIAGGYCDYAPFPHPSGYTDLWWGTDNAHYITHEYTPVLGHQWKVYRTAGAELLQTSLYSDDLYGAVAFSSGDVGKSEGNTVFARVVLAKNELRGEPTFLLPDDDFAGSGEGLNYGVGYAGGLIKATAWYQDTPAPYGRMRNGGYYIKPLGDDAPDIMPLGRGDWRPYASLWFDPLNDSKPIDEDGRDPYEEKNALDLTSVISSLLKEIGSSVTHENDPLYSWFLYNPYNPITSRNNPKFLITQKTNILNNSYDEPANSAPLRLADVFEMLKNTMQLYWHIEAGRLIIEHISYYKRGRSYNISPTIGADLTTLKDRRTGKEWGYGQNSFTFAKADLTQRYEFNYMDDVTPGFAGLPIVMNSKFVEQGKVDSIAVSKFTPDIDYMIANPGDFDKKGFALMYAEYDDVSYTERSDRSDPVSMSGRYASKKIDESGVLVAASPGWVDMYSVTPNTAIQIRGYARENAMVYAFYKDFGANYLIQTGTWRGDDGGTWFDETIQVPWMDGNSGGWLAISQPGGSVLNLYKFQGWKLPIVPLWFGDLLYYLQNGWLSWIYAHYSFWTYDLPSRDATINGETNTYISDIKRRKIQKVKYPAPPVLIDGVGSIHSIVDPTHLVKTALGKGQIDEISISLLSGMAEATLKFATDE